MYPKLKIPVNLLLFYVGCFPFLNFGTGYDSLPLLLILFVVLIGYQNRVIDVAIVIILILIGSIATSLISIDRFSMSLFVRGLSNQMTAIVAFYVAYECLSHRTALDKHIKVVNGIYIIASVIQLSDPLFFDFLISGRTGIGRGVNSLTVEPSMFSLISLSFVALSMRYHTKESRMIWLTINSLAIVFLAKSALGILILLIMLSLYIFKLSIKSFILITAIFIAIYFVSTLSIWDGTRVSRLLDLLRAEGVLRLMFLDSSISGRVSHLICSITYSFSNFGFPNGYYAFVEAYGACNETIFGNAIGRDANPKIMSLFGSMFFELGPILLSLIAVLLLRRKIDDVGLNKDTISALLIGFMAFTPGFVPLYLLFFRAQKNNA